MSLVFFYTNQFPRYSGVDRILKSSRVGASGSLCGFASVCHFSQNFLCSGKTKLSKFCSFTFLFTPFETIDWEWELSKFHYHVVQWYFLVPMLKSKCNSIKGKSNPLEFENYYFAELNLRKFLVLLRLLAIISQSKLLFSWDHF